MPQATARGAGQGVCVFEQAKDKAIADYQKGLPLSNAAKLPQKAQDALTS
jgi:hypothetical protein